MTTIVGHKGTCGYAPENTLRSFGAAIDANCSRAELDVRLTADNQVIVIHDETVDRTTDGKGLVRSFSLEQIQKLHCEDGQIIPTLQQVIDYCGDKIDLQIELKEVGTPKLVNDIIVKNQISAHVVVSSFYPELLAEIEGLNISLKTLLLFREQPEALWKVVDELSLYAIGPKADIVTPTMVKEAHSRAIKVYAYRTNTKELGEKMLEMGADELGTDYPKLFKL